MVSPLFYLARRLRIVPRRVSAERLRQSKKPCPEKCRILKKSSSITAHSSLPKWFFSLFVTLSFRVYHKNPARPQALGGLALSGRPWFRRLARTREMQAFMRIGFVYSMDLKQDFKRGELWSTEEHLTILME
jgi:hypothetical protein